MVKSTNNAKNHPLRRCLIEGSIPGASAIEHPQREIVDVITYVGLEPDGADLTQLTQAVTTLIVNSQSVSILPGTVTWFASSSAPDGTLKCNGAAISRVLYADLFAAIGTIFGTGDGSTTFNLPDLRGEFIRGWDDGRGIDAGRVFGSFQADELKSHTHTIPGSSSVTSGTQGVERPNNYPPDRSVTSGATGGPETRPRNIALLAVIKY